MSIKHQKKNQAFNRENWVLRSNNLARSILRFYQVNLLHLSQVQIEIFLEDTVLIIRLEPCVDTPVQILWGAAEISVDYHS